ncbi:MAG: elongation factor G [Christensenella sp.]|nr:elongation factor G [Christensenella sp.]
MKEYNSQDILNIAVVGHGGEGKTTLTEAMLFNSGALERMGRVEDGNTTTDYDGEEIKRQISISMAMAPVEWKNKKINLVDVPGYFDFEGEAVAAYLLCDAALIVLGPNGTVPVGAQKAYDYCVKHGIPHAFVINQVDKENTDYLKTVAALGTKYTSAVTALEIPIVTDGKFVGVVDIIDNKAYLFDGASLKETSIPDDLQADAEALRETLVENAAANDEELMEKFFDGQELSKDDIMKGLKEGILLGGIAPVFAAAAAPNVGITKLMDDLILLMPTAADVGSYKLNDDTEIKIDASGTFVARVLKTIADPFVGRLSIIKVLRGTLTPDMTVTNANTGKPEKCSNLGIMKGKKLINVSKLPAGDIGAIAKLQHTATGDTLYAAGTAIKFPPIEFPQPCISLAVSAKKKGDEEKVFSGLHRLEDEDPTFKLIKDTETGDMLANGMGEMHLEIINNKLKSKFNVEGALSDPKIPYREAIKKAVKAQGKHKKQSGGHGQYGDVWIEFSPVPDGLADFVFEDKIVGGVVPRQYIPAVEKGLKESVQKGVLAGYPVVGLKCTLYDGSYHTVDSSEMAFKVAANLAFKKGIAEATPVLLEPIVKVEVLIPDEYMGDIIGDLNRRRGRILGMNPMDGMQEVVAEVPMSEMFKYATDLRSMTQARGSFKQTFERYEEVPAQMADKVIERAKKNMEEA